MDPTPAPGRSLDDRRQLCGCPDGSGLDNGPRYSPRGMLFAVSKDQVGELFFGKAIDEITGRDGCPWIKAHIERPGACKREAASLVRQLHGRETEVEH